jgi:hypothetical protein
MKTIIGTLLSLIFLTTQAQAQARATGQQPFAKCLPTIESRFGKPATTEAPVYELSTTYAVEVEFDKDCQLVWAQIAPKYFWEQKISAWIEPHSPPELNTTDYDHGLSRIKELRTVGRLIRKGDAGISIVTNSKQYSWDEYEHAFINRVMHCCDNKLAFSIYIYFLKTVQGKIQKTRPRNTLGTFPHRVMINNQWYLIPSNEKVSLGKRAQLRAAGPMTQF